MPSATAVSWTFSISQEFVPARTVPINGEGTPFNMIQGTHHNPGNAGPP